MSQTASSLPAVAAPAIEPRRARRTFAAPTPPHAQPIVPVVPPRRVVLVVENGALGGTEINTAAVARALARAGHTVTVLESGRPVYAELLAGTGARVVHTGVDRLPTRPRWWLRTLRPWAGDVCVVSKGGFETRSAALDVAARLLFRRYVAIENHPAPPIPARSSRRHLGGRIPGLGLWWYRTYLPRTAGTMVHRALVQRVVSVSDVVAERLVDTRGYAPARIVRVHCGVDLAAFRPAPEAGARERARLGIPATALVMGSVGRLHEIKRPELAVALFAEARRRLDRDAWLVLAGEGPAREGVLEAARRHGVADRVVLPGWVPEAAPVLAAIDVFLMTSREEGLGIALLEALATGCRCVAMEAGGTGEILSDPAVGWLVPGDDAEAFVRAVLAAATLDEGEVARRVERGRRLVAERFDGERQAERMAAAVLGA